MQQNQIILFLLVSLLLPLVTENLILFHHHSKVRAERATPDECCVSSKLNVATKKANNGRDFFRRLSNEDDSYKQVNPENMCNLIHFLIQQASLNNKSVTFTKGMFVIFDSTNQIFEQFMKAKNKQKSGDEAKNSGYFNRLKHMFHQAFDKKLLKNSEEDSDTFIYVRGDESSHYHEERGSKSDRKQDYPAYGMDIPGACMPSGFGHILFGKLPSIKNSGKYAGERIYLKPEFFGIRQLEDFIKHGQSYFDHISKRYVCQLKEMRRKPGCSVEDAFRENTDNKLLKKWKNVLITIPLIPRLKKKLMKNATNYGIGEIYRQAKIIEEVDEVDQIKDFLSTMIEQYGTDDISVRKGREIIFTTKELNQSPLTCEFLSHMKKC